MHILNEFMDEGQLNLEKFAAYHMKQLELFIPKLKLEINYTYDEFRKIIDEIYYWEYIAEIIYTLEKRFENSFATLISDVNDILIGNFEYFLNKLDIDLSKIRDDKTEAFHLQTKSKMINKLNLIKDDLKRIGLIEKLNPRIEEISQIHEFEKHIEFMSEETKKRPGLVKEIIILTVEFALMVSFLVGLTYLGDPFLYEPPAFLSSLSPPVYQGLALGSSGLFIVVFIIYVSYEFKSLEFISEFLQISGLSFGAILILMQFGLVQFGVWSALFVFGIIMMFYTAFAQGSRKLTITILIAALIIEFILVSIYLIDFWSDSFQFMSDFWISRFIIADIAIVFSWVGSHSMEKTLKETPYVL